MELLLKLVPLAAHHHAIPVAVRLRARDYGIDHGSLETADALDQAIAAADKGFKQWRRVSAFERSKVLRKAADLVRARADEIAKVLTLEQGKVLAEAKMDAERYADAERILKEVEAVNPELPELWARRATIAHLEGRFEQEGRMRKRGLEAWPLNPEVDYLIGKQLSHHYRFAESVEYQRRALLMQNDYVPAKAQLAQDLLRLGVGEEGWRMVDEVRKADPYHVPIFNLKKLHARLEKFATLEAPGFVVRMDAVEAKIFGGCNSLYRNNDLYKVGERNISIALEVLRDYNIHVSAQHVGGQHGRKIVFNTATGKVRMRLLVKNQDINEEIDKGFGY
jgi:tetratricopeptide (TPR) repeat protein